MFASLRSPLLRPLPAGDPARGRRHRAEVLEGEAAPAEHRVHRAVELRDRHQPKRLLAHRRRTGRPLGVARITWICPRIIELGGLRRVGRGRRLRLIVVAVDPSVGPIDRHRRRRDHTGIEDELGLLDRRVDPGLWRGDNSFGVAAGDHLRLVAGFRNPPQYPDRDPDGADRRHRTTPGHHSQLVGRRPGGRPDPPGLGLPGLRRVEWLDGETSLASRPIRRRLSISAITSAAVFGR